MNIILNAIFIPVYGYMAAAYTTLFGYIVMALIEALWAIKLHRNETGTNESVYDDRKILTLSVVTTILALTGLIWYQNTILRYIVTAIGIVASAFFVRKNLKDRKKR